MTKFKEYRGIYPLFAIFSGILIIAFGLAAAEKFYGTLFLCGVVVWLVAFGYWRNCLCMLGATAVIGGIFATIAYFCAGGAGSAMAMMNRFGAILLGIVPGMSTEPVRITRNLSQIHTPRAITLGMLITMSFTPLLKEETRRVREAMKVRGAGSILNPKIFYRALLMPLVIRLVNIADTLTLSVETRGFTIGKAPYTIYKKESIHLLDILFVVGILAGAIAVVIL